MTSSTKKSRCCIKRNIIALFFYLLLGTHQSAYYTQALPEDTNVFDDFLSIFAQFHHESILS